MKSTDRGLGERRQSSAGGWQTSGDLIGYAVEAADGYLGALLIFAPRRRA
jgi:hypothetical protein